MNAMKRKKDKQNRMNKDEFLRWMHMTRYEGSGENERTQRNERDKRMCWKCDVEGRRKERLKEKGERVSQK